MIDNNAIYNNTFYKTFSGTDALAFMILPECQPILLGSVTTISYSMYRDKKPVTLIGKVNVSGYTRGMRVIAGSLVFTLINQHLTKDIHDQVGYLSAHGKVKADELPMFDIMIICANEYGKATRMMIYGIDITDDSQVLSIQDTIIENTFNFVARDVDEFTMYKDITKNSSSNSPRSFDKIDTHTYNTVHGFDMLNYNPFNVSYTGDLFNELQRKLVDNKLLKKYTGVFDNDTLNAIKKVQKMFDLPQSGILDENTYNSILSLDINNNNNVINCIVVNKNGANIYLDNLFECKCNSLKYLERIICNVDENGNITTTCNGYNVFIKAEDIEDVNTIMSYVSPLSHDNEVSCSIDKLNEIGVSINHNCSLKASCISFFESGNTKHTSKVYDNLNNGDKCTLYDLSDAYIYDIEEDAQPTKLLYIIKLLDIFYKWEVVLQ